MPPGVRPFKPVADDAKLQFAQRLMANGVPKLSQPWGSGIAAQVGRQFQQIANSVVTTPVDVAEWGANQVERLATGEKPKDQFNPANYGGSNLVTGTLAGINAATNRAAGDIASIPGVGKPSASPTASDIRNYGVAEGLGRAAVDYGNLAAMAYPMAKAGVGAARMVEVADIANQLARDMTRDDLLRFAKTSRSSGINPNRYYDELMAFNDYLGDNFPQYQDYLRSPNEPGSMSMTAKDRSAIIQRNVTMIDELLNRAYGLQRPTVLYRGIKGGPNIARQAYVNKLLNAEIGDVIVEPGYLSTTIDPEMAQGFARNDYGVVLEISAPRGTRALSPMNRSDTSPLYVDPERELTLPRNTSLRITGRNGNVIQAEVVPNAG